MSIRRLLTVTALALLPVAALAADISGNWTASFDTLIGHIDYAYTFAGKDGLLTGRIRVGGDETALQNGKVVSPDESRFSRDVMGMVQEEMVAKRAK